MSTANFDPRYLEIWRDGGTTGVSLPMPDVGSAVNVRQRLYRLRDAMKKEKHPWFEAAERATISINFTFKDGAKARYQMNKQLAKLIAEHGEPIVIALEIQPPDNRFNDVLEKAGYKLSEPPPLD